MFSFPSKENKSENKLCVLRASERNPVFSGDAGCPAESGIAGLERDKIAMKSYRDLEIYTLSYELAIKIHKISLKLAKSVAKQEI